MPRSTKRELRGIARNIAGIYNPERGHSTSEFQRKEALIHWAEHPWNFISGTNPDDGKPLIYTRDEREKNSKKAVKHFPADW